jgi:hypothetical protein
MNDTTEMKRSIKKIVGKAYSSCVKAERKAAKRLIKFAAKRTSGWNKDNVTIRKPYDKIQNNETCPCESGLKYKKCCLKRLNDKEQAVYEDIHSRSRAVKQIKKMIRKQNDGKPTRNVVDSPLILPDSCQDKEVKIIIP